MAFEISVTVHPRHLAIRVTGEQTVVAVVTLLETIEAETRRAQTNHVLVDYLGVTTRGLSAEDRRLLGARLADIAGNRLKIAVVYRAPQIDQTTILTATRKGAAVTTVATEEEGVAWLSAWQPR